MQILLYHTRVAKEQIRRNGTAQLKALSHDIFNPPGNLLQHDFNFADTPVRLQTLLPKFTDTLLNAPFL